MNSSYSEMRFPKLSTLFDVPHPKAVAHKFNTLYHTRVGTRPFNTNGVDILAEDWDNLVILDGCRYDLFKQHNNLSGRLESRTSRGTSTKEFLEANFSNQELLDTVYVTANPVFYRNQAALQTRFHSTINIWSDDGWNEEYKTVLPDTVTEYAKQASDEYPNKRLIVHYIQPHYPFITSETSFDKTHLHDPSDQDLDFWKKIKFGELDITSSQLWDLYEDNLKEVLPHVGELLDHLAGKTVVTADHGNMIGERASPIPIREWGHPARIYTKELVKIPWLVCEAKERKQVKEEEQEDSHRRVDDEVVGNRLRELGYIE